MTGYRFVWTSLTALCGTAALVALQVAAQDGPSPQRAAEIREEGALGDRTIYARNEPTLHQPNAAINPPQTRVEYFDQRLPDGTVHRRAFAVPVISGSAPDPESQKLLAEEQSLVHEVRRLTDNLLGIDGTPEARQTEWKSQIREKLAAIFDLQQQRRTREIAKIEERLDKLKETLKKREAAKDSIVDRRLETMTGGVDELGWEETFPQGPSAGRYPTLALPEPVPVPGDPNYGGPTRKPLPPPVAPGPYGPPGAPPAPPAPALTPSPAR